MTMRSRDDAVRWARRRLEGLVGMTETDRREGNLMAARLRRQAAMARAQEFLRPRSAGR